MSTVLKAIAVGGVAALLYRTWKHNEFEAAAAAPMPYVRDAGPEEQSLKNEDWDGVDQQIDESFPASDPPGNY